MHCQHGLLMNWQEQESPKMSLSHFLRVHYQYEEVVYYMLYAFDACLQCLYGSLMGWNQTETYKNWMHVTPVYAILTLTVLNFWKFTSYCSLKPLLSGMVEVVPAHTSPTLHPPSPPTSTLRVNILTLVHSTFKLTWQAVCVRGGRCFCTLSACTGNWMAGKEGLQQKLRTSQFVLHFTLTLKVLNFWKFTSYCSLKPLWSGMGEVVPARTSPTLHPPSPPTVHQLSWLAL